MQVFVDEERCRGHGMCTTLKHQVNEGLLAKAGGDVFFLPCLPAHREADVVFLNPLDVAYPFAQSDGKERLFHAESSGASAIAAGALLLVLGANPTLRLSELEAATTSTSEQIVRTVGSPEPFQQVVTKVDGAALASGDRVVLLLVTQTQGGIELSPLAASSKLGAAPPLPSGLAGRGDEEVRPRGQVLSPGALILIVGAEHQSIDRDLAPAQGGPRARRRHQDAGTSGLTEGAEIAGGEVGAVGAFDPLPIERVLAAGLEPLANRHDRPLAVFGQQGDRAPGRLISPGDMQLNAALGTSLMFTAGAVAEIGAVGTKALEIAENLGDAEYQLRSLWGLWAFRITGGQHCIALTLAQRFHALAAKRSEPNDRLIGEQMIGTSEHYLGDQPSARRHIERVLAHYVAPARKSQIVRFRVDQRATARVYLARILWLQGLPDQAMRTAESSVADAQATNHAMSLGHALAVAACPIALWVGDLAAAEHYVETLLDYSTRHALARWRAFGRSYQGVLAIQRGNLGIGLRLLRAGFDEPGAAESILRFFTFLMAEALGRAGQIAAGLAAIEEAIVRSERTEEGWVIAELLRIKGELLLLHGGSGAAAAAEDHYQQALGWACRQGALSWELRAATSLARLLRDQNRSAEAIALLAPIYNRFTEGFETADLKTAKALIDGLYTTEGTSRLPLMMASGTARRRLA